MPIRSETALYEPLKSFLAARGYQVRGEVQGCDLVAVRGEDLVVVELKPAMNLTLILQGLDRLRMTDTVYLAIEAPRRAKLLRWTETIQLCRRLGLGLITVRFGRRGPRVEVVCDPAPYKPRPAPGRKSRLLGEFQRRTGDHNVGGSNRRPLVTAYREEALGLAIRLKSEGPTRVKLLREATGCKKAGVILHDNHYGWFEPVARGVYQLTAKGEEALQLYADVIADWGSAEKAEGCPDQ